MLLEVEGLSLCYDTAQVLDRLSFEAHEGEVVCLVGPNGAGKTTALRAVAGLINWEKEIARGTRLSKIDYQGRITFAGDRIENMSAPEIAKRGLSLCPERGRPFREMTVLDNLLAGAYLREEKKKENLERIFDLFPILKRKKNQMALTLSGGERIMLAVGRSLMSAPRLLCIDEPSIGLAPMVRDELLNTLRNICLKGTTILIAEQDISFAFKLASRSYVMARGRVVACGDCDDLLSDKTVARRYLGL